MEVRSPCESFPPLGWAVPHVGRPQNPATRRDRTLPRIERSPPHCQRLSYASGGAVSAREQSGFEVFLSRHQGPAQFHAALAPSEASGRKRKVHRPNFTLEL